MAPLPVNRIGEELSDSLRSHISSIERGDLLVSLFRMNIFIRFLALLVVTI